MPMCDAYIPAGALSPSAERELLGRITDLLLEHEGVDPANEKARKLAWVFVHRPEVYVAGAPPKTPRYRFICQVPEGLYNDERRAAMTAALTQAVVDAEHGSWPHPELRVCVFTCEIPDGWLGWSGKDHQASRHLRVRLAAQAGHGRPAARDGRPGAFGAAARSGRADSHRRQRPS